jgi:hypothetical protein
VDTSVHSRPAEFRDSWLKLERGINLADQFKASADEFLGRRPFTITTTTDATHHRFTVWVTVEPPPDDLGLLLGDATHNLRSALDCLVAAMARRAGGADDETQFPICDDPRQFESRYRARRLRCLAANEIDFLEQLQPYHQGLRFIHPLCYLRDMSNADKHRLIVPTLVAAEHVPIGPAWRMESTADLRISNGPFIPNEPCVLAHVPFDVAPTAEAAVVEPQLSIELPAAMHRDAGVRLSMITGTVRSILVDAGALPRHSH